MEKLFVKLRVAQVLLAIIRILLCFYEIFDRFKNREIFDNKVHRFTGGTISIDNDLFKLIQVAILFLFVTCSVACIYFIVKENRPGIGCMLVLLGANLVLQLYQFGMYSNSLVAILVVCSFEVLELFGLYKLYRWIRDKNQYCNNEREKHYILWYTEKLFERAEREEMDSTSNVQTDGPVNTEVKQIDEQPPRVRNVEDIQCQEEIGFTVDKLIKMLKEHEVTQKIVKCSNIEMMAKRNVERKMEKYPSIFKPEKTKKNKKNKKKRRSSN